MRELIEARNRTKQALETGKQALKFARNMQKADNPTRFKTLGKLLGWLALGVSLWWIRRVWAAAQNIDVQKEGLSMMSGFLGNKRRF